MNKDQLLEAMAGKVGSKKDAGTALDAMVDVITNTLKKDDKVAISGFGVF